MTIDSGPAERRCIRVGRILLGPIGTRILLTLYSFFMLTFTEFVSVTRDGSYHLAKERYTILLCWVLLVEALNQITFWLGKKDYARAVVIRSVLFWIIFSGTVVVYLHYLFQLSRDVVYSWHKVIFHLVLYLILSVIMSHYSLTPEFRFLILRGKFQKRNAS